MSTSNKAQFLLLFRNANDGPDPTPEEMQQIMGKWMDWLRGLKTEGIYLGGHQLEDEGKVLRGAKFTDGPFVESKEIVGGYIAFLADNLAQAEKIARGCPGLEYGTSVELRPLIPPQI
jgi:hypothetical protein